MSAPVVTASCNAPGEVAQIACNTSKTKASLPLGKLIILGLLAGAYIGFGAYLATTVGHDASKFLGNGVGQLLFGSVFSVGLMMVVIGGSELFTGNNMFMMVGALEGTTTWRSLWKNWAVVWVTNLVGALILVMIIYGAFYATGDGAGLFKGGIGAKALAVAKAKVELTFWSALLRGILCNWLVCMAVWLALASKDVIGKIFSCFFPIMAFVTMGMEHSVANMFFIPMGLMVSDNETILNVAAAAAAGPEAAQAAIDAFKTAVADHLTWGTFFYKNLIPVTIGNIIGGGIFVGSAYWFTYVRKSKKVRAEEAAKAASEK
ncbi:MAG: formate/nitrite transporter family protein [Thermoleophilia bacterium]|nr:formate/nitrite transporter family protein [Thermoleophilia bacterium]